jgi:hypothetical protein
MVAGVDLRLEDKRLELRYSWGVHNTGFDVFQGWEANGF